MDERLADLCKTCNIREGYERVCVQEAVEQHGLAVVLSAMKRLSIIPRNKGKYPIEQFSDVLSQKVREATR